MFPRHNVTILPNSWDIKGVSTADLPSSIGFGSNIDYLTTENQLGLVAHFTPSEYKELWTYLVSSPSARYAE